MGELKRKKKRQKRDSMHEGNRKKERKGEEMKGVARARWGIIIFL